MFEIDEEVAPEEVQPESSRVEAAAAAAVLEAASPDADLDEGPLSSGSFKPASISASLSAGGSLSALAAAELEPERSEQKWDSPNFDPSSLRVEDYMGRASASDASSRMPMAAAAAAADRSPRRKEDRSKAKLTMGDAEARLSGLLAPHAPSHRQLWTEGDSKKIQKYALNEVDDVKWAAWKDRVLAKEADAVEAASEDGSSTSGRSSKTPPVGSILIRGSSGVGFSSIIHDGSSGFDREPKTSLPYNERMMVPSLKKATRRVVSNRVPTAVAPSLPTIKDEIEAQSTSAKSSVGAKIAAIAKDSVRRGNDSALPGSVSQKGFVTASDPPTPSAQGANQAPGADPQASGATAPPPAVLAGIHAPASSSRLSPRLGGSPRPQYVPPPPPTSSNLVLVPDPKEVPAPLILFDGAADKSFATKEKDDHPDGYDMAKMVKFMHRLQMLKLNKRTGWIHHRVKQPESICDHMYRVAVLAMLCPGEDVDIGRCVMMALIHDLAEAEVGDLTPLDNVPKEEKLLRERNAIDYFVHDLLDSSPAALRIEALWQEYEDRETKESKLVKDLDRFELCLQAVEYERRDNILDLQPFFRSSINLITHPSQRQWAKQLAKERQEMWAERGQKYEQTFVSEDVIG